MLRKEKKEIKDISPYQVLYIEGEKERKGQE
jgi:hypothetical protein